MDFQSSDSKDLTVCTKSSIICFCRQLETVLFTFQQTYTSSLPKSLLLGVHQRGVHLIEAKTFVSVFVLPCEPGIARIFEYL